MLANRVLCFGIAIVLLTSFGTAHAKRRMNPVLFAEIGGIDDDRLRSGALRISDLEVRVEIFGGLATGTLTARFVNPSSEVLEGDFSLELPASAVVIGYALDVRGEMVDGVLAEPQKAEEVYAEKVRAGVDPGVATVSRSNVFSTRVFPIFAGLGRTIRLRFAAPVHPETGLGMPFATASRVGRISFQLRCDAVIEPPSLRLPSGLDADWERVGGAFVASAQGHRRRLSGQLRLGAVQPLRAALVTTHSNGRRFFQVRDTAPSRAREGSAPLRVRVYWDRSLSRRDDRIRQEVSLLTRYLDRVRPAAIDVVLFNSSGVSVHPVESSRELREVLRWVRYRGATSFAVLEGVPLPAANACLMFSDGVRTIDARGRFEPGCELFAISSASDADLGSLRALTLSRGGQVFRLGQASESDILASMLGSVPRVIEALDRHGTPLRFAPLDVGSDGWAAVGEAPVHGDVVLRIEGLGPEPIQRTYPLGHAVRFEGAAALWAHAQLGIVAAEEDRRDSAVALSREYSVASPLLSFIVLEAPGDYADADIVPPSTYPKALFAEYRVARAARERDREREKAERLERVIAAWNEQVEWWETGRERAASRAPGVQRVAPVRSSPGIEAIEVTGERVEWDVQDEAQAITAFSMESLAGYTSRSGSSSRIGIELEPWNPRRPYLIALDAAESGNVARVLAQQEVKHGTLPAFYIDVAEWLHRKEHVPEAIEILLSALELPACNTETMSIVAGRLLRYQQVERGIWLHEAVLEVVPDRPQPLRSLALALAQRAAALADGPARADLLRAADLLLQVVLEPWDEDFDGIELVSLMDLNALLPRLHELGGTPEGLDPRLRALLDVDLRVVIEWNTAATDLDLWIDQPDTERAYYGNRLTAIGGRISNDMTQGFGPEEYLLRRAIPGAYGIRVNVYAIDPINPNGSTTVTAHLFRDFGRDAQREETIEIELLPDERGAQLVGKFDVTPP